MEHIRTRASVECQAARTRKDGITAISAINCNGSVSAGEMEGVVTTASKNDNGYRA